MVQSYRTAEPQEKSTEAEPRHQEYLSFEIIPYVTAYTKLTVSHAQGRTRCDLTTRQKLTTLAISKGDTTNPAGFILRAVRYIIRLAISTEAKLNRAVRGNLPVPINTTRSDR